MGMFWAAVVVAVATVAFVWWRVWQSQIDPRRPRHGFWSE